MSINWHPCIVYNDSNCQENTDITCISNCRAVALSNILGKLVNRLISSSQLKRLITSDFQFGFKNNIQQCRVLLCFLNNPVSSISRCFKSF